MGDLSDYDSFAATYGTGNECNVSKARPGTPARAVAVRCGAS